MPRTQPAGRRVRVLLAGLLLGLAGVTGPATHSALSAETLSAEALSAQTRSAEATRYIVKLSEPPLASYRGGIAGLPPTNPAALGQVKLDADSPASTTYLGYLASRHEIVKTAMNTALGRDVDVLFDYRYAFNGLAVELTPAQVATVRGLPGVADVQPDFERRLLTDAGPAWIGAPAIWEGTAGAPGTRGEGVVIGLIDTGINVSHPSFADVGGDGYDHTNPRGRFYGLCAPLTGAPFCNDKLIGVHDFTGTTPLDDNGHGSHTASTAAGNVLPVAKLTAPTTSITRKISGVAPHANLITYKGCVVIGSCIGVTIIAAIDQAVADEVDVLNYSIGGGPSDPWADDDSEAFLGARDAGVLAVVSAGNSGPGAGTVGSPANAPWVLSVGAATHNRALLNSLVGLTGGDTPAPADIVGRSVTAGYGPAPLVYAGDFGDPLCSTGAFLPGTFHGEIVICDRGVNPRLEKGRNVRLAGAGGMVLANSEADGEAAVADPHELPAVGIGFTAGQALKQWVSTGEGHQGSITGTVVSLDAREGDVMAAFSSRGPNLPAPDVIKPDVAAPGVDILAALNSTNPLAPPAFGLLSGTSMSSPHATGAAALLRALRPEWTPAQVVSALTSTGRTTGLRKEDRTTAADPFDLGAGRIDLAAAGRAGLVLGETTPDFRAANPATGGDPAALNLATMAHQDCKGRCSWLREVTNTLPTTTTWQLSAVPDGVALSVKPEQIRLAPGESALLTVTAEVADLPSGQWAFGAVTLTPQQSTAAVQHLAVAVLPGGAAQPVSLETASASGSTSVPVQAPVDITEFTAEVFGLQPGELTQWQVPQDPTVLDPYDGSAGTMHTTVQVPDGAPLLTAEIVDTTSSDLDLYVGLDADGDGAPDPNEQVCASATEAAAESCRLDNPAGGTYWIMVVNYTTGQVLDDVTLQTVVISPVDNGNLTVTGPDSPVAAGESFPVELTWDEPEMQPGSTWFALVRLSSRPDRAGDVGSLLVRLSRPADG
ncbi:MAG: S8 family serine peptidase [Pseudonocardiaceae bacterium]